MLVDVKASPRLSCNWLFMICSIFKRSAFTVKKLERAISSTCIPYIIKYRLEICLLIDAYLTI